MTAPIGRIMNQDHYSTLAVKRTASAEDIHRAYRALALRYHPDRNPAPDAAAHMAVINEAYEVLGDPAKRRQYDALTERTPSHSELAGAVLAAARDVVLRTGWVVVEDLGKVLLLEKSRQRVRAVFLERASNDMLQHAASLYREPILVLTLAVESAVHAPPGVAVIDLLHGQRYGTPQQAAAFEMLLAGFV